MTRFKDINFEHATKFFNLMLKNNMQDNIITLPEGESFPVNHGSLCVNANKFFLKRMDDVIFNYFDKFILKNNQEQGVIVIGAPGVGKVIDLILL